ncbi:MAG TPA: hypothetical protein ENL10_05160 [Candidatus Cloacimonetes bacterium]|nr:hypothetical protein [Candidatus Cloacimonadota bacterium]
MGKAVLIMALLLAVIVVIASVTLSVERKSGVIPDKIAENEVRSDLINLGAYALKWAIKEVRNEDIIESNTSFFDNESGSYHYAFFNVPVLDGSIDRIIYEFGEPQYEDSGGEDEEEEVNTVVTLISPNETMWIDNAHNSVKCNESKLHMRAKENHGSVEYRRTYLFFGEESLPSEMQSVSIRIDADVKTSTTIGIYSTSWDGVCTVWDSLPAVGSLIDTQQVDNNGFVFFDVSSGISEGDLSFVLKIYDETIPAGVHEKHVDFSDPFIYALVEEEEDEEDETIITIISPDQNMFVDSENPTSVKCNENKLHMRAKEHHGSVEYRRTYIFFDEESLPSNMETVLLRIDADAKNSASVGVYNTSWDGVCTDWNGAPAVGSLIASKEVSSNGFVYFDITSAISEGDLSFVLKIEDETLPAGVHEKHIDFSDPCLYLERAIEADSPTSPYTVQVDISTLVSEDEYGNENDRNSFASILVSYDVDSEGAPTTTLSMEADLNINPTNNASKRFQMQTPSGQIDRDTLHSNGSSYTYSGTATEIRLKPKSGGNTITVNGSDIVLATSTVYTITSDVMTVYLRNSHGPGNAMGHWWIDITCTDVTVSPDPGLPEPDDYDDEEDEEITLEDVEILYWKP